MVSNHPLARTLLPLYADAQSTKPLIFDSIPISDVDESANFKTCGYQFRGQIDQENWDTMLQVLIYKNKNNDYFVSTGLAEKSTIKSNWNPKHSVVQWVRVGAAEPLKLDPYNLITIPDKGASAFSTPKSKAYNVFNEIEKKIALSGSESSIKKTMNTACTQE